MPVTINKKTEIIHVVFDIPVQKRFAYRLPVHGNFLCKPGQRVNVPFGTRMMIGYVVDITATESVYNLKEIVSCIDDKPLITEELLQLSLWIADEYGCSQGEALAAFLSPRLVLKKSLPVIKLQNLPNAGAQIPVLTDNQEKILIDIEAALKAQETKSFLIHGVTGSGKTEIYLRAIAVALSQGRQALYLVPEITMTPLFINRLQERFGSIVAQWHSQMSVGEKLAVWRGLLSNNTRIIIGARSAVFLPFTKLGAIIIDEEHDHSYKQDQKPYYHAHAVAHRRAETHRAVLILGSATPSIETYTNALNGRHVLHSLKNRIDDRPLPKVNLINLGGNQRGRFPEIFSEELKQGIRRCLARREQAILFLNRRGYAPFIRCGSCGWVSTCSQCSVSLVYHRESVKQKPHAYHDDFFSCVKEHSYAHSIHKRPDPDGHTERLICHYCGIVTPLPDQCPECGKRTIRLAGIGTQKVESELRRIFPGARIARLDRDSASKKGFYSKVYQDFSKEKIDILLGTQIVAKGFDFPRVTLVGVIEADTALHVPDFRSAEKTFQLITQVAGRAGRSELGGEVIVQTFYPDHCALQTAAHHDYHTFYAQEITVRRELSYPPFKRLLSLTFRGKNEVFVKKECEQAADFIYCQKNLQFDLCGPSPAIRSMLHGKHRWQMVVKADSPVCKTILNLMKNWKPKKDVLLSAEIDPVSLL